jgi:hypothetical protein
MQVSQIPDFSCAEAIALETGQLQSSFGESKSINIGWRHR